MPSSDGCQSGGNRLAHAALCSAALILGCEGRDGAGDFGTMGGDPILMTFVWPPSGEQTAAMATASDPVFIGLMKVRTDYRDGEYQEFIAGRRAAAASSARHSSASTVDRRWQHTGSRKCQLQYKAIIGTASLGEFSILHEIGNVFTCVE
jgi:hypothetical protein